MRSHSNITKDIFCQLFVRENFFYCVPAVSHGVKLEEVIFTSVATHLELRSKTVSRSQTLSFSNRGYDILLVVLEAHRPLIQLRGGNHCILFVHFVSN